MALEDELKNMEGRKLLELWLKDGEEDHLVFAFEEGPPVVWRTEGDCCSESWFADIVGVEAVLGSILTSVETVDMAAIGYSVDDGRSRADSDEVYGFKLRSSAGMCDIVFRNSSNGYYGGWLEVHKDLPKGFPEDFSRLKDDLGPGAAGQPKIGEWLAIKEAADLEKAARRAPRVSLTRPKPGRFKAL